MISPSFSIQVHTQEVLLVVLQPFAVKTEVQVSRKRKLQARKAQTFQLSILK